MLGIAIEESVGGGAGTVGMEGVVAKVALEKKVDGFFE